MPEQVSKARQDREELFLGALFLVDNAPECPEEMSWHDFVDWAIAEHLKRHSYYYYQKGNRELVTITRMRSCILGICNNYAEPNMPKASKQDKEFKDKVDVLFGFGRFELLREDLLARRGYEKGKFPESRLSKHVSEEDAPVNDASIGGRPENETSEENNGSDTNKFNSHDVGEEERRESEADPAAPPATQSTLPPESSHVGTSSQPPDNSHTAPKASTSDEQPSPSQGGRRRLRSSIDLQTQTPSAANSTSSVNGKANTASTGKDPVPHKESVVGAKRKPTQDDGPHKRQCQIKNTTRQENSSDRTPHTDSIPQAERPSKTPSTGNGTKSPEAPKLTRLNLDQQGRNMKQLYSDIQAATDVTLSSIGNVRNTLSPLQPKPSGPLRDLFARCWGPRWEEVRVRQGVDQVFTTPQVTASLLSAFLYEKVLTQGARLQEIVSKVVEMGGSLGEALLEEVDISNRSTAIAKRARMIEAQKAYSKLTQEGEPLQQQLKLEADSLAKDASAIMSPHLDALSCIAKLYGLSSNRSETDTLGVFESEFAKVIQRTLDYRLQLLATGCEYTFTWPRPDEVFESGNMQTDGGRAENTAGESIVLFTVFPGLEIKPMSSDEMESVPDAKAVVKVQRSEDRS